MERYCGRFSTMSDAHAKGFSGRSHQFSPYADPQAGCGRHGPQPEYNGPPGRPQDALDWVSRLDNASHSRQARSYKQSANQPAPFSGASNANTSSDGR